MARSRLPGPVFISHSSVDKEFVRRLDSDLEGSGFDTWLDEKSMVPGDSLPAKISSGLDEASAVVVVISPASEASRWLRYELQLATDRMVKGLRVIPVLLADAAMPPELRGLLYADFRSDYDRGFELLIRALEQLEASIERAAPHFYERVRNLLGQVFDSVGFMSLMGEYRSLDFNVCSIGRQGGPDLEIVYDELAAYGRSADPVKDTLWREFLDVMEDSLTVYQLLVSERPVEISQPLLADEPRIRVQHDAAGALLRIAENREYERVAFAVDLSGGIGEDEAKRLFEIVKQHVSSLEDAVDD